MKPIELLIERSVLKVLRLYTLIDLCRMDDESARQRSLALRSLVTLNMPSEIAS